MAAVPPSGLLRLDPSSVGYGVATARPTLPAHTLTTHTPNQPQLSSPLKLLPGASSCVSGVSHGLAAASTLPSQRPALQHPLAVADAGPLHITSLLWGECNVLQDKDVMMSDDGRSKQLPVVYTSDLKAFVKLSQACLQVGGLMKASSAALLGHHLLLLGHFSEAVSAYRLGLWLGAGMYDQAPDTLQDKDIYSMHYGLGVANYELGNMAAALRSLEVVLGMPRFPKQGNVHWLLGQVSMVYLKDPTNALAHFSFALQKGQTLVPNFELWLHMAKVYGQLGAEDAKRWSLVQAHATLMSSVVAPTKHQVALQVLRQLADMSCKAFGKPVPGEPPLMHLYSQILAFEPYDPEACAALTSPLLLLRGPNEVSGNVPWLFNLDKAHCALSSNGSAFGMSGARSDHGCSVPPTLQPPPLQPKTSVRKRKRTSAPLHHALPSSRACQPSTTTGQQQPPSLPGSSPRSAVPCSTSTSALQAQVAATATAATRGPVRNTHSPLVNTSATTTTAPSAASSACMPANNAAVVMPGNDASEAAAAAAAMSNGSTGCNSRHCGAAGGVPTATVAAAVAAAPNATAAVVVLGDGVRRPPPVSRGSNEVWAPTLAKRWIKPAKTLVVRPWETPGVSTNRMLRAERCLRQPVKPATGREHSSAASSRSLAPAEAPLKSPMPPPGNSEAASQPNRLRATAPSSAQDLATSCENSSNSVSLLANVLEAFGISTSVFTLNALAAAGKGITIETRLQRYQKGPDNRTANGKRQWQYKSRRGFLLFDDYVAYARKQAENPSFKPNEPITFGTNIDFSADTWRVQLRELQRLPNFLRVVDEANMLSTLDRHILGVNTVQAYVKVPGCRTPAHQENNNFASVNINFGPGRCEWFCVEPQYFEQMENLGRSHGCEFLTDSWWPCLDELEEAGVPVVRFVQEPGETVYVNCGTVHWVQALSSCINVAWNIGALNAYQFQSAWDRYDLQVERRMINLVPMKQVTWKLSERSDLPDRKVADLVRQRLEQSLKSLRQEHDQVEQRKLQVLTTTHVDATHCHCCNHEIFNCWLTALRVPSSRYRPREYCCKCAVKQLRGQVVCHRKHGITHFEDLLRKFVQRYGLEQEMSSSCDLD